LPDLIRPHLTEKTKGFIRKKIYLVAYTLAVLLAGMFLGQTVANSSATYHWARCTDGEITCDIAIENKSTLCVTIYQPYKLVSLHRRGLQAVIKISK